MGDLNEKEASGVTKIVSKDEDYAVEVNSLGEMSVSVQNQPTITVGNSSLSTNATIQNSSLTTENRMVYSSTVVDSIHTSSDLQLWTQAGPSGDNQLHKVYNASFDSNNTDEATVTYFQFQNKTSGNCLVRYRTFSGTTPYALVHEQYKVGTWSSTIEESVNPPLVLTAGTITHPANNASEGTTVCNFTFSGGHSSSSTYTFSSNSNLYYLKADSGTAAQTITATSGQTVSLCTSSNFADYSSSGYTHTSTITLSDSVGLSSSTSVDVVTTQGGATAYSNTKCFNNAGAGNADYFTISNLISGSNQVLGKEHDWTISFWYKGTDSNGPIFGGSNDHSSFHCLIYSLAGHDNLMLQYNQGSVSYTGTDIHDGNWKHVCITFKAAPSGTNWYWLRDDSSNQSGLAVYINNTRATGYTQTAGSSNLSAELFSGSDFRFFSRGTWSDSAQGDYDEIAIFDSCKSDTEVANIYSSGTPDDLSSDTSCKVYLRADGMSTANITNGMTITNSSTASDASNYVTTATTDNAGDLEVKDLASTESIYVSGTVFNEKYIKALNYSSNTASYTQYLQTNQHPWGSGNMSAITDWSVSFWMKWEGSTTETNDDGHGYIISIINDENATKAGWTFYISSSGNLRWYFANAAGTSVSGPEYNNTRDTLTDGNWHFVCFTHKAGSTHTFSISSSSSYHKLWVDGVFQTPTTAKSSSYLAYGSNNPVTFGTHPYAGRQNATRSADVSIDEIAFWDVDLADDISASSSATITAMYNSGTAVDESSRSGLLEYYRADTTGDSIAGSGYIKCAKHPSSTDHKLIPYYYDASDTRQQGWTYTTNGNGIANY